jgi:hypothetical protein
MTTPSVESYRKIPLTQDLFAIVDPEDYDELMRFNWYAQYFPGLRGFYAARSERQPDGTQKTVLMHRQILALSAGDKRKGDHAFHITLDNRKFISGKPNLRIADAAENSRNRKLNHWHSTGFKGVQRCGDKYRARIFADGRVRHLGVRDSAEAAHALYVQAANEIHGAFAYAG